MSVEKATAPQETPRVRAADFPAVAVSGNPVEDGRGTVRGGSGLSAVVLAGGRSLRMGRDKAWLDCGGMPLILRQIKLLQQLGPDEIFISAGSSRSDLDLGLTVLSDAFPGQGPLAGLERALEVTDQRLLLALAVDLPRMTASMLRQIVGAAHANAGVVPRINGQLEPLVACYPKRAHRLAADRLEAGQNSARGFASACLAGGLAEILDLPSAASGEFTNWNVPGDVEAPG